MIGIALPFDSNRSNDRIRSRLFQKLGIFETRAWVSSIPGPCSDEARFSSEANFPCADQRWTVDKTFSGPPHCPNSSTKTKNTSLTEKRGPTTLKNSEIEHREEILTISYSLPLVNHVGEFEWEESKENEDDNHACTLQTEGRQNQSFALTLKSDNFKKGNKRSVRFDTEVRVMDIPSHSEYSKFMKQLIWNSPRDIQQNARRNRREFAAEGWNWRNVLEEDQMYLDRLSQEFIHPVHLGGSINDLI